MSDSRQAADSATIRAKWAEIAAIVDRLATRIQDPDDFPVLPGSPLAADDSAAHPFEVSQAVRHLINASVDQLHGAKTVLHETAHEHLAVGSTLARAALENTAAALWILGPSEQRHRLERVLRWHARNYTDESNAMGHLLPEDPRRHLSRIDDVARANGIEAPVRNGYKVTAPIEGAQAFTSIEVRFLWSMASGFAHGRPWAYQGLLRREQIAVDDHGGGIYRLAPRADFAIFLPLQALHLLGELIRLRDRRAGLPMPPMPDGSPDRPESPRG